MRFLHRRPAMARPAEDPPPIPDPPMPADVPTQLARLRGLLDHLDFARVGYAKAADLVSLPDRPVTAARLEALHRGEAADVAAAELEQIAALVARDPSAVLTDAAVADRVDAQLTLLAALTAFKQRTGVLSVHTCPPPDLSTPAGMRDYAATLRMLVEIAPDLCQAEDPTPGRACSGAEARASGRASGDGVNG